MPDLTQKALATICDVTATRIRQLVAEGAITRKPNAKYDLTAVTEYIRFLRQAHAEQRGTPTAEVDYRQLMEQEKYRQMQRENAIAERLVAPVSLIEEAVGRGVAAMLPVLESLPLLVKRECPEITGEQVERVKRAVAICRNALADVKVVFDE